MTTNPIAPITYDAVASSAPVEQQPAVGGMSAFSDTLTRSSLASGSVDLDAIFEAAGQKYNLSPNLLKAVARVESNFRPNATSRAGAMGIMQLMPGTARGLGVSDAYDPEQNIMGGAKYLRSQLDRFGCIRVALSAYNAGPSRVAGNGGQVLSFTQGYVNKVLGQLGGGDITAGMVSYNGFDISSRIVESSGSFDFNGIMAQMLFIKMIEMQMGSSKDDDRKVF